MSSLVIEIHSDEVEHRSGVSKAGKDWEMFEQEAWVRFNNAPFPEKIKINIKDKTPIKRGIYVLDPSRVCTVGNFGSLEINDRKIQDALELKSALKEAQA
jgi:hypothetical protein